MSWAEILKLLPDFIAVVIAMAAFLYTRSSAHRDQVMAPYRIELTQMRDALVAHASDAKGFQSEVRENLVALKDQVHGLQVAALDKFATKAELDKCTGDLRVEIGTSRRIDELAERLPRRRGG